VFAREARALSNDSRALIAASIVLPVLLAFVAFRDVFAYSFTTGDILGLIRSSIIDHVSDLGRIFSEPLSGSVTDLVPFHFYRPVSTLSYSFDYAVWGLDPFGYHLTDVMLHAAVGACVALCARRVFGFSALVSMVLAALFVIHPLHVHTIPGMARRQDVLATLWLLVSLLLTVEGWERQDRRARTMRWLGYLTYLLALGSKETAVTLLPILFCYRIVRFEERWVSVAAVINTLRTLLPFIILTAAFVALHTWVLGGLGGYKAEGHGEQTHTLLRYVVAFVDDGLAAGARRGGPEASTWAVCGGMLALFIATPFVVSRERRGLALVLIGWLASNVLVLVPAKRYVFWYSYAFVIPFVGLTILVVLDSIKKLENRKPPEIVSAGVVAVAFVGILALNLVRSPVVKSYSGWRVLSTFVTDFLREFDARAAAMPMGAKIEVHDSTTIRRHVTDVFADSAVARTDAIQSWVAMKYPDKQFDIVWQTEKRPPSKSPKIVVEMQQRSPTEFTFNVTHPQ
jgi:hypothetical protein